MNSADFTPIDSSVPYLSVVMPVYNEAATVHVIIGLVLKQTMVKELIIVNDCSTDNTYEVLKGIAANESRIRLYTHDVNQGKGAALRTGIQKAEGSVVIIQDADLEYDPAEYCKILAPMLSGRADVVYGSRFLGSEAHRVLYYWHYLGNNVITQVSNMFSNLNCTDIETCYKAFRREIIQSITLEENRFGFEPEVTAKIANYTPRLRIYEVAISYYGRTYEEGKKIGWRDGFRAMYAIVKYNLFR
ncbi:glycosyl transferase [Verrucomicrobia bacterium LW23]|nr:glycosyl transferase [Verrucomicrobia bacterium LW23]